MRTLALRKLAILVSGLFLLQVAAVSCPCAVTTAEAQSEHACCQSVAEADKSGDGCCATESPTEEPSTGEQAPCTCLHAAPQPAVPPAAPSLARNDQSTGEVVLPTASMAEPMFSAATGAVHDSEPLRLALFIPQWAASRAPPLL